MQTVPAESPPTVHCPGCAAPLPVDPPEALGECPRCHRRTTLRTFPLFSRPAPAPQAAPARALEGEAACFFHPEKIAGAACDRCGRFICSLCDFPMGSRHLCPTCIARGMGSSTANFARTRVSWGHITLLLGLLPLLGALFLWPVLPFTGPATIFTFFHANRRPGSLVSGKHRAAAVAGLLFGLVQILIVAGAAFFFWKVQTHG